MTILAFPTPYSPFRGFANDGTPLAGGLLWSYAAGTNTPLVTYQDPGQVSPNANPVVLNARGEAPVFLPPNVAYKFLLTDSLGNTIPGWPIDNLVFPQLITLYGGVDTGSANTYIINFTGNFSSLTNGIFVYWVPANTNTGPSTINVNNLGVVSILNTDGSALGAGEIVANGIVSVIYFNGNWYLTSAVGSVPKTGSFAGTPTGFNPSLAPVTIHYVVNANLVTLSIPFINGTSNSTFFTITGLPANLQPVTARAAYPIATAYDNGNPIGGALAQFDAGSGTITLLKSGGSFPWTNTAAKGLGYIAGIFQYGNTVTYNLL
jgi:hypothetical protein